MLRTRSSSCDCSSVTPTGDLLDDLQAVRTSSAVVPLSGKGRKPGVGRQLRHDCSHSMHVMSKLLCTPGVHASLQLLTSDTQGTYY